MDRGGQDGVGIHRPERSPDSCSAFHIDHLPGKQDALFWAADIVAGAVRAHREGIAEYRRTLADCLYEIHLDAGC